MTRVEHEVLDMQFINQGLQDLGFPSLTAFTSFLNEMNDGELAQYAAQIDSVFSPGSPATTLVKGQLQYLLMIREGNQGGGTLVVDDSLRDGK